MLPFPTLHTSAPCAALDGDVPRDEDELWRGRHDERAQRARLRAGLGGRGGRGEVGEVVGRKKEGKSEDRITRVGAFHL